MGRLLPAPFGSKRQLAIVRLLTCFLPVFVVVHYIEVNRFVPETDTGPFAS